MPWWLRIAACCCRMRAVPLKPCLDSGHGRKLERFGALTLDPEFDEARFNLALAHLRAGQREDAGIEARELLKRLPPDAPQRAEVTRMLSSLQ